MDLNSNSNLYQCIFSDILNLAEGYQLQKVLPNVTHLQLIDSTILAVSVSRA